VIVVLAFIINLFAPIVNTIGAFGLLGCIIYDDLHILALVSILAIVGLVFGIFAYRMDIPPRWFWAKSKNELFRFSVTAVLGYAWSFAMWPCAIYMIMVIVDKISML
jgi:hypothetical protein